MKLAVIDTETTELTPTLGKIVEVALVTVDTETGEIRRMFNMLAHPRLSRAEVERTWIVQSGHISLDEIIKARHNAVVAFGLRHHLGKLPWTSYNVQFDYSFLKKSPWRLPPPGQDCIMARATHACEIPTPGPLGDEGAYKWPKLSEAYEILVGGEFNGHRAMDDAIAAAKVMLALIKKGNYIVRELSE